MKKEVLDKSIVFDIDESTIEETIESFEELRRTHVKPHHTRHYIKRHYFGYDGGFENRLLLFRLETDKEETDREELERVSKERAEKKRLAKLEKKLAKQAEEEKIERAEYERLKEKYGE